jgi:hypothetical protein
MSLGLGSIESPGENRLENHDQAVRVALAPDLGLRPRVGRVRTRPVDCTRSQTSGWLLRYDKMLH